MMRELDLTEDDLRRQLRATEPPERSQRKQPLEIISAQESFRRVRERGPRKYLISPIWPEKTYGATGAEDKAGKSWDQADAGISVATGTPYLNRFPTAVGPVLLFQGEGSEEMFTRRAKAIIEDRGGTESDLDLLRVCYRAPGLTNREHLAQIDAELREFRPILVGIDPLYLSAAGAKGSDLYGMGELFRPIQEITEGAGSALRVTTHWNKTGTGTGPQRFTGVGPGAWGRVLGSASVEKRRTLENGGSEVLLKWEYMGSEISETHFFMRRRVWVDDPNDLNSPMHYSVEVTDADTDASTGDGFIPSRRRVFAALQGTDPEGAHLTIREIGDRVANDGQGPPLKEITIRRSLADLGRDGLADSMQADGMRGEWWAS